MVLRAGGSVEGTGGALRVYSGSSAGAGNSGDIELTTPGNNQISGDISVSSGDALVILHVYMTTSLVPDLLFFVSLGIIGRRAASKRGFCDRERRQCFFASRCRTGWWRRRSADQLDHGCFVTYRV